MKTFDKSRVGAYFKAYVICLTALVGLYVVIDAFANLDEFFQRAGGAWDLFRVMGRYYWVHIHEFVLRLGMLAAIVTMFWMQLSHLKRGRTASFRGQG